MSAKASEPALGASLRPATVVSRRYLVKEMLGRGGMGDVYRVFDTARGHDVALKQLRAPREPRPQNLSVPPPEEKHAGLPPAALDDAHHAQRLTLFRREYRTLAELAHPRIIEVYEYGVENEVPYYTMELLTGRDIVELAPSPWPRVCAVLRDVASALTLLHSRRLLHRDLSPTNVHQQRDGSCKLIDFGAMGSMGKQNAMVGTPPFMPPELLRQLPLDARSDLYSLAALGYLLLTGRTVHPVRSLAELYNFLEVRPTAPSTYAMGVPSALDALILQMLSPDAAARPSTTIEVLERLSAIDGVQHESEARSLPLSVATPGLVGRSAELKIVQRSLSLALGGEGSSLLVVGPTGSGRSRFLDACLLEGRLLGARVLRSAADTSSGTAYGVISALLRQLHASLGSLERAELALPHDVAACLLPESLPATTAARGRPSTQATEERAARVDWALLHAHLLEYLCAVAERGCVMLAIDDFERVDSRSATLIAALAQRARAGHKLLVMVAVDGAALSFSCDAVRAFTACSQELCLPALTRAETESLLASVFGEVPNIGPVATNLHRLSAGNPRQTMELAQHLVDAGVIRCETGGYLLPETIASSALPASFSEALCERVQLLSEDAQALASALALCADVPLSPEECFAICELSPATRGERALRELIEANIAELRGASVALRQATIADALVRALLPATQRMLHARVAARLVTDPARRLHAADHYFRADLESEAVDALLSATGDDQASRVWHPGYRSLIERGVRACERFARPARQAFTLQSALVQQVVSFNEPCERQQLLSLSDLLCRLSGLRDWEELSDVPSPEARLAAAVGRAEARYQATPEHARILAPHAALRQLISYLAKLSGFGSSALDIDLLAALPSLMPFAPLEPAIMAVERLHASLLEMRRGRPEIYLATVTELAEQLHEPGCSGFPASEARSFRVNLLYGLGLTNAMLGRAAAFEQAREMESVPRHRVNAWRIRQLAHLFLGDPQSAEACRREVELLQLETPSRQFHQGGTVAAESLAYAAADDLLGLRRVLPAIEEMAAKHVGWRPLLGLTRAALQRVRGRAREALALYEAALQSLPAARHSHWGHAAAGVLRALNDLGRTEEARERGEAYVRAAEAAGWSLVRHSIELPLADTEARLGQHEQARTRVERMIQESDALGIRGLYLGALYEGAARQAVLARDAERFAKAYARCSEHLRHGCQPAVTARLDRLLDQARRAQLAPQGAKGEDRLALNPERIVQELSTCKQEERGAVALQLLMSATGASAGHLYRATRTGLSALASFSSIPEPPQLRDFLQRFLQSAEVLNDQTVDLADENWRIVADCSIEALLLTAPRGSERTIVGVAALSFAGGRRWPDPTLLEAIAEQLGVS